MTVQQQPGPEVVVAARAGDQRALDRLIAGYLPLVYNVVGRALDGHADVDDVVQETMIRAVDGLPTLREPERFRSWLVAIAVRQVRDRWRARQPAPVGLDPVADEADPGADFADLAILELGLSGQRKEAVEATRWLDDEERELVSLWWLETAGELSRADLASATGLTPQHAAVRLQRVKARLETARAVVRALSVVPRCEELVALAGDWNGRPTALWRKRFARHVRECPACLMSGADLVPAEGLLAGLALVPLPLGLAAAALSRIGGGTGTAGKVAGAGRALGRVVGRLAVKPVAVAVTGAVVVGGGAAAAFAWPAGVPPVAATAPGPQSPSPGDPPSVPPSASPSAPPSGTPSPSTSVSKATPGSAAPSAVRPVYGQTVDAVDLAPAVNALPRPLPVRPEGRAISVTGQYEEAFKGSLGGRYLMFFRGDNLTVTGQGYIQIRWEVAYFNRAGELRMPTWTGLTGKLFHVASGGSRRMSDTVPGATDLPHTWMGRPDKGYDTLPAGTQQMWQNEFYYLDGSVTLHQNETGAADYNLGVTPVTRDQVVADINTPPSDNPALGRVRYGLVRDTGADDTPVPQYLTRSEPADPTAVVQHSVLS